MVTVSIHQPGYLPWLGFFEKILVSDLFVFLDDVQYVKKQWHNRNYIKLEHGSQLLSVPVHSKFGMNLNKVMIDYSKQWITEHEKLITKAYSHSSYFDEYFPNIQSIFSKNHSFLIDLNIEIITYINKILEIDTKIVKSSDLNISTAGSNRILDICKKFDADEYFSGIMGHDYLSLDDFQNNSIEIVFQNYTYPIYCQQFNSFLNNMSIIDLIMNEGPKSKNYILSKKS